MEQSFLDVLAYQKDHEGERSLYRACQCSFSYSSNRIEGSRLSFGQVVELFDHRGAAGMVAEDDVTEARNHFSAFDWILDTGDEPLGPEYLCCLHRLLKEGTSDAEDPGMAVGSFKRRSNEIAGQVQDVQTALPEEVPALIDGLIAGYEGTRTHSFADIVCFHWSFERIHPFSDGNGRVGRLIMFKECLRARITPFIITEDLRAYYLRGLREFTRTPGYLMDTCGLAQDCFEAAYLPLMQQAADSTRDSSRE